ncbi:MAG TPA: hypothetical protein PKA19_16105, partial [Bacillota bacterium]|nr:hypothetical protein [Bacillota bacterium]
MKGTLARLFSALIVIAMVFTVISTDLNLQKISAAKDAAAKEKLMRAQEQEAVEASEQKQLKEEQKRLREEQEQNLKKLLAEQMKQR